MYRAGAEIGGVPLRLAPVEKTPVFGPPTPKMWPPNLSIRSLPAESQNGGGRGGSPLFLGFFHQFNRGIFGFLGIFGGFWGFLGGRGQFWGPRENPVFRGNKKNTNKKIPPSRSPGHKTVISQRLDNTSLRNKLIKEQRLKTER